MKDKLTKAQEDLLQIIKWGALRYRDGKYFYSTGTSRRRSGQFNVSIKTVKKLIQLKAITENELPHPITK